MAKGISVGITSETQGFEAGVKSGVIKPLEDVVDATDEAAKAGAKAGQTLERSFDDAGDSATNLGKDAERSGEDVEKALRDAQKETGELAKEYKQLGDTVKRESREAGRETRSNFKDGTDGAKSSLKEVGEEAGSTARETAASFDGSKESIIGGFQEIAANAFVGLGPAAAAAGLAGAAGIGLITTAFQASEDAAAEMEQATNDAFENMIESGGRYLTQEIQNAAIKDVIKEKWKEIKEISDLTGLSTDVVARGYALGGTELDKVKGKLTDVYDANNQLITTGEGFTDTLVDQNGKIAEQVEKLNSVNGVQAEALEKAKAYDAATGGAVKARSDERDMIQDRNRALTETPKEITTKLVLDDSDAQRKLSKFMNSKINVVLNAVDKFGKEIR